MGKRKMSFKDKLAHKLAKSDVDECVKLWQSKYLKGVTTFQFDTSSSELFRYNVIQKMLPELDMVQPSTYTVEFSTKQSVLDKCFFGSGHTFENKLIEKNLKLVAKSIVEEWQEKFLNDVTEFEFEESTPSVVRKMVCEILSETLDVIHCGEFNIKCQLKKTVDEELAESASMGKTIVYTDGSCLNIGKDNVKGGIGVWFGTNDPRNISKLLRMEKITNNTAELQAVIEALKATSGPIEIRMDSEYVQKGSMIWFKGWQARGDTSKKNYEMFEEINKLIEGREVEMTWVPREKNKEADLLSRSSY